MSNLASGFFIFVGLCGLLWAISMCKRAASADDALSDAITRRRAQQVETMFRQGAISESERGILLRHVSEGGVLDPVALDDDGRATTDWERELTKEVNQ